jgi:hypothetical protein
MCDTESDVVKKEVVGEREALDPVGQDQRRRSWKVYRIYSEVSNYQATVHGCMTGTLKTKPTILVYAAAAVCRVGCKASYTNIQVFKR